MPRGGAEGRSSRRPGKPVTWRRTPAWFAATIHTMEAADEHRRTVARPRRGRVPGNEECNRSCTSGRCPIPTAVSQNGMSRHSSARTRGEPNAVESCTSGSEGRPQKPTRCETNRALWSDPTPTSPQGGSFVPERGHGRLEPPGGEAGQWRRICVHKLVLDALDMALYRRRPGSIKSPLRSRQSVAKFQKTVLDGAQASRAI